MVSEPDNPAVLPFSPDLRGWAGRRHRAAPAATRTCAPCCRAAIQSAGEIRVGTEPTAPPYLFYGEDNKTLVGLEDELAQALGERLGVKFTFMPTQFASIIPGIQADRFDMGMSAMGDFVPREKDRRRGRLQLRGDGDHRPGRQPAPHHEAERRLRPESGRPCRARSRWSSSTSRRGSARPTSRWRCCSSPRTTSLPLALRSGRADVLDGHLWCRRLHARASAGVNRRPEARTRQGRALRGRLPGDRGSKYAPQLRDAIKAALESMMADGSYEALFAKWDLAATCCPPSRSTMPPVTPTT